MDDQGNPIDIKGQVENHLQQDVEVPAGDQQQLLDEANLVLDEANLDEAEANPDIMGDQQHQNIRMANYKLPMFNGTGPSCF
jgi:hypothetical protein